MQVLHSEDASVPPLFYKYFSDLTPEQIQRYDSAGGEMDQRFAGQRGTLLGVTIPYCGPWFNPNGEERPKQCLLKLYDDQARQLKLNDVVTVIGHLEFNRKVASEDAQMQDAAGDSEVELRTDIPNDHLLPHLHVLAMRQNQRMHTHPLLKKADAKSQLVVENSQSLKETKGRLLAVFKLLLNGDAFAAEYLLLSWLARVHTRKDSFIIGHLPINLTNITFLQGRHLLKFLQSITPLLCPLPLSIENLSQTRFSPKKNYDTNILEQGQLQFIDGTLVVADETVLKEGMIMGEGVSNIKALATLAEQQIVEYDFQYYQQSYPVNAGIIILSDGRSMFKNTLQVPVGLGKAAGPPPFDESNFHQWLTLARLEAVSEGSMQLGKEVFDRARELERERLVRVALSVQKAAV
ncbi:hypothetical protein FGO68_gene9640 [Halteria grandinella]|uniref:Mini-chromosome maintenance complex-binding protein n=1 Tax=Halteria grandinella TaxID=5974 RepID=A0A8J8NZI0_HALGN|nr:hypothetical protein FGO68_gene9640 [Halteria grandinella]